jgi:hypothetical protein
VFHQPRRTKPVLDADEEASVFGERTFQSFQFISTLVDKGQEDMYYYNRGDKKAEPSI